MPLGSRMQIWWQPLSIQDTQLSFALVGDVGDDRYLGFGPAVPGAKDRLMGGANVAAGGILSASSQAWAGK